MLAAYFDAMERSFPFGMSRPEAVAAFGENGLEALVDAGWLDAVALDGRARWPCPSPGGAGCPRRLVERDDGGFVAVCGQGDPECEEVELWGDEAVRVVVDARAWIAGLARGLGAVAAAGAGGADLVRVGERAFGAQRVAFWFAARAAAPGSLAVLGDVVARERDAVVVVLVPQAARVPREIAEGIRSRGAELLGLDERCRVEGRGVTVDLADFVLARRLPVEDVPAALWPRYWLVMDPAAARFAWAGRWLDLDAQPRTRTMLMELATAPGRLVTRDALAQALWPDAYGKARNAEVAWDRRIREHKKTLADAMRAVWRADAGLAEEPIEIVAGDDLGGGYRLNVPKGRVGWWTPHAAIAHTVLGDADHR